MSAHTPASKQRNGGGGGMATPARNLPSTPSADTDAGTPKILSSKVLGMKFMQRASEGVVRQRLETERSQVVRDQQWTAPSTPVSQHAAAAFAGQSPSPAAAASPSPSPFGGFSGVSASSVFAAEEEASATPSLPYSAITGEAALPVNTAPPPPFVAGRRSYGSFNTTVDALVAEAHVLSKQQAKGIKADARDKKYSVSDNAMTDHYVGLRGKGISRPAGGGGGGGGGGKKRSNGGDDAQPRKKHKPSNKKR